MLISFCCRVNVILVTTLFFHFPFGFLQFPGKYDLLFDSFSVEETAVKGRGRKREEQQVGDALIPCLYFLRFINRQTERERSQLLTALTDPVSFLLWTKLFVLS